VLGVFFQQLFEDLTSLRGIAREEVRLRRLELLRTLAPRAEWCAESQVAEEIEGVGVRLLGRLGQLGKIHAALLQALDDLRTLGRIGPLRAQLRRRRTQGPNRFPRVFGITDHAELLAVRVQLVNQVRRDLDLAAVEVEFLPPLPQRFDDLGTSVSRRFAFRLRFGLADGGDFPLLVDFLLGDPHRITIKGGIGEEPRGRAV
jgi:hypothetical protein